MCKYYNLPITHTTIVGVLIKIEITLHLFVDLAIILIILRMD